jgi:hypothetical protein
VPVTKPGTAALTGCADVEIAAVNAALQIEAVLIGRVILILTRVATRATCEVIPGIFAITVARLSAVRALMHR